MSARPQVKRVFQPESSRLWITVAVTHENSLSLQVKSPHSAAQYVYIDKGLAQEFLRMVEAALTFSEYEQAMEARDTQEG